MFGDTNSVQIGEQTTTITFALYGAAQDTVYYMDGENQVILCTTDTNGVANDVQLEIPNEGIELTLYSTIADDPTDTSKKFSKNVNFTKTTDLVDFDVSLPIANIGDVIIIGGKNVMCVDINRFIYLYYLGYAQWDKAIENAKNWEEPVEISNLYNVSDKRLMTKSEGNSIGSSGCSLLYSFAWVVWTNTEYEYDNKYAYATNNVSVGRNMKVDNNSWLPTFTISKKHNI